MLPILIGKQTLINEQLEQNSFFSECNIFSNFFLKSLERKQQDRETVFH